MAVMSTLRSLCELETGGEPVLGLDGELDKPDKPELQGTIF